MREEFNRWSAELPEQQIAKRLGEKEFEGNAELLKHTDSADTTKCCATGTCS